MKKPDKMKKGRMDKVSIRSKEKERPEKDEEIGMA